MDLSLVIPTCGRPPLLGRVLAALAMAPQVAFEVHVVCDGVSARTALAEAPTDLPYPLHVWTAGPPAAAWGAARARNLGVTHAQAPRVLFIDDDCLCPPALLRLHAQAAELVGLCGLRRHLRPAEHARLTPADFARLGYGGPGTAIAGHPEMRSTQISRLLALCQSQSPHITHYCWTCHLSLPTAVVRAVGGFWEAMLGSGHEDCELALRCFRAGVRYQLLRQPWVWHQDHPKQEGQTRHAPANRGRYQQTRDDPEIVVRNGGPLPFVAPCGVLEAVA